MAEVTDAMAAVLAGQLQEQQRAEDKFRASQDAQQSRMNGVYDDVISRITQQQKGPQYTKDVTDIANALTVHPRLVPAVQQFLSRLVSRVNAAIDAEIAASVPKEPPK